MIELNFLEGIVAFNTRTAQQSVHLTLGILRTSQAVSHALAFFWLDGFAVLAPAQVTQTVRWLPCKAINKEKNMNSFLAKFMGWFKNSSDESLPNDAFKCATCGKFHVGLPMDMAYKNPGRYFEIPAKERNARIYLSTDICVIDDSEFYIRGVLPIPVVDSDDEFHWGLWAKVEKDDFDIYSKYWDGNLPDNLPALHGLLSGSMKDYPDSDMTPIEIYLQSGNQRPVFKVISDENSLGIDQRKGITIQKVHSFVEPLLK